MTITFPDFVVNCLFYPEITIYNSPRKHQPWGQKNCSPSVVSGSLGEDHPVVMWCFALCFCLNNKYWNWNSLPRNLIALHSFPLIQNFQVAISNILGVLIFSFLFGLDRLYRSKKEQQKICVKKRLRQPTIFCSTFCFAFYGW